MKYLLKHKLVFFVYLTIFLLIGIQFYWNYKSYIENQAKIISEITTSLDRSIEKYFKSQMIKTMIPVNLGTGTVISNKNSKNKSTILDLNKVNKTTTSKNDGFTQIKEEQSINLKENNNNLSKSITSDAMDMVIKITANQSNPKDINLEKINEYFNKILKEDGYDFNYQIKITDNNELINEFYTSQRKNFPTEVSSKSNYLKDTTKIKVRFPNLVLFNLKLGFSVLLLSFILSLSILFCFFYLMHIIKQQKELAIIKNDFVSNITHELKTPITVVKAALEGIKTFSKNNQREKVPKYMDISVEQLNKLQSMVEKILETSTMESNKLNLNFKPQDICKICESVISRLKLHTDKHIFTEITDCPIILKIDPFHFENVITNLVENAIKYGGTKIIFEIKIKNQFCEILVKDNGKGIDKSHTKKVFDKFYRVPTKDNRHDVKGYGIGLYYVKNIIEKHDGTIELLTNKMTTFKIKLPYGK